MADFDPYYKWFAIPPEEQPPHHYRLLGLTTFESDPDVISAAADRQLIHLRSYERTGPADLVERLFNEISTARLTLLVPESKQSYDNALRARLEAAASVPPNALPSPVDESAPEAPRDAPAEAASSSLVPSLFEDLSDILAAAGTGPAEPSLAAPRVGPDFSQAWQPPEPTSEQTFTVPPPSRRWSGMPAEPPRSTSEVGSVSAAPAPPAPEPAADSPAQAEATLPSTPPALVSGAGFGARVAGCLAQLVGIPDEPEEERREQQRSALALAAIGIVGSLMSGYVLLMVLNFAGLPLPRTLSLLPGLRRSAADQPNEAASAATDRRTRKHEAPGVPDPWGQNLVDAQVVTLHPGTNRLFYESTGDAARIRIERTRRDGAVPEMSYYPLAVVWPRSPSTRFPYHRLQLHPYITADAGTTGHLVLKVAAAPGMTFASPAEFQLQVRFLRGETTSASQVSSYAATAFDFAKWRAPSEAIFDRFVPLEGSAGQRDEQTLGRQFFCPPVEQLFLVTEISVGKDDEPRDVQVYVESSPAAVGPQQPFAVLRVHDPKADARF